MVVFLAEAGFLVVVFLAEAGFLVVVFLAEDGFLPRVDFLPPPTLIGFSALFKIAPILLGLNAFGPLFNSGCNNSD